MRSLRGLIGAAILQAIPSLAQIDAEVTPFWAQGHIDAATANGPEYNAGGTILVDGFNITVPENLVWGYPSTWPTLTDIISANLIGESAMEIQVAGNMVNGTPIAAQITISQVILNLGQGYVESIDFADGSMKILGGPTIRINDPEGVYAVPFTSNPLFSSDDESPSITAFSGFPMCIPRSDNDDACPQSNRPIGLTDFDAVDRTRMAPFEVGDYLSFAGYQEGGEVLCYSIVAMNVQITTQSGPGTFIRLDEVTFGVFDDSPNVELSDTKFVGYVSTPNEGVTISAIDVDPCTGIETERIIGSAFPVDFANDPRNVFTFRADTTTRGQYTREYRIRADAGPATMANGIVAGVYTEPILTWIYPELAIPGDQLPPTDFTQFGHLANGWNDGNRSFFQLNPWPGSEIPAGTTSCGNSSSSQPDGPPVAFAGADITNRPGVVINLVGVNNNTGISNNLLTYQWTQTAGEAVTLIGNNTHQASFTAPAQTASQASLTRTFQLMISMTLNGTVVNSTDTVDVITKTSVPDVVTIDEFTFTSRQGGTVSITAHSNVVLTGVGAATLSLTLAGVPAAMTQAGPGIWTFSSRSTRQPSSITVTSNLGGSATLTSTTSKKRSVSTKSSRTPKRRRSIRHP